MNCISPVSIYHDKMYIVPCGKCLACLTTKRMDWSLRLMQEWKASNGAFFITLTYHPRSLPEKGLSKRHVQLYIKRLRKNHEEKHGIRYYAVGEYGSRTERPHYHIILFNVVDSKAIRRSWTYKRREIGFVHIGEINEASIQYCTKYIIQRSSHTSKFNNPPFALMSRAYGIGGNYLTDEMVQWHRDADRNYVNLYGQKLRLPRYYKEKIWWSYKKKAVMDGYIDMVDVKHPRREIVQKNALDLVNKRKEENDQILRSKGYDPATIQADMWRAVLSRVMEKVSYTQKF